MAEVMALIGLAASVSGLLTLVGQVSKLSYGFISDVRNASKSQKLYLQEISALTEALLRIEQALEVQDLGSIRPSSIPTTALQDCQELLNSIKTSLEKTTQSSSRIEKLKSSLAWPFDEKEVKRFVERINRCRDIFVAALSSDTFAVSVATYRKVDDLSREKDHQRILEWLGNPGPPRSASALFDSACPGTGQWLLTHKAYLEWRDSGVCFLWCYGKPGVGKTVMSSIVLDDLKKFCITPTASVIHHFCDFADRKVEKTEVILKRLLRQILHEANPAQLSLLEQHRQNWSNPSLKELSQILLDVIRVKTDVYLVIDALDELHDRKIFIPILRDLAKAGIKVFVTSREIPDIQDAFHTERKIEIQASRADLENFVANSFQENDYCDSLKADSVVISAIVDQSGGMFLLAQLLMKHLLSLTSVKQMKQALKSMPSNLTDAYESSSRRISEQPLSRMNLAMRVIGWIAHAERRLKVEELRHALAVEEHTSEIDEENLTLVKVILQVCVGLVFIDPVDGTIGMIHATAYDYFRHQEGRFVEIQLDMAKTSMLYLSLHPLCDGACSSVELLRDRHRDMPFLGYAAKHWGDHARHVETEISYQIFKVLNDPAIRASSFQALQFYELRSQELAAATFGSLPTGLEPLHVAAYWNLSSTAESILKDGVNPSMLDNQGWTALHWAASQGYEEMVELLLEYKADIDACDHARWTPLFWATIKDRQQVVTRLLRGNANHLLADTNHWTVLHWAASKHNTTITQILLDHHSKFRAGQKPAQIAIKDVTVELAKQLCKPLAHANKSPLEIAADGQDIHTFNAILEDLAMNRSTEGFNEIWEQRGFDEPAVSVPWRVLVKVDAFDVKGLTRWDLNEKKGSPGDWKSKLLHGAVRDGKALVVRLLLELGADIQDGNRNRTPLHQAAFLKDPEVVDILLANGADVSATTREGQTPLHFAVSNGFDRTAEALLRGGADINARNNVGDTPLMLACGTSSKDKNPTRDSETISLVMVKMLIDHGADPCATNEQGSNALHLAVQSHLPNFHIIKLLLENGIDANIPDSQGYNPLYYLSEAPWFRSELSRQVDLEVDEIFDLLLSYSGPGAESMEYQCQSWTLNLGCIQEVVRTPLSLTIKSAHWRAFHFLLEKGAILHPMTPLDDLMWEAASFVQSRAVELLLAHGANVAIKQNDTTPLGHIALRGLLREKSSASLDDFKSVLKMYMDAGLDINATDKENQSLLHVAVSEPQGSSVSQHLIEVGADMYQPICGTWDTFLLAAVHGNLPALRDLFGHAAKTPNSKHWIDWKTSDYSDEDDHIDIVCGSLARSSLIDSKNLTGITPLQMSVELGNVTTVSKLLSHGANIHVRDEYGWTLLHAATRAKNEAMVKLLLEAGSDVLATSERWARQWDRPSGLYHGGEWKGTPLHLAAMLGQPTIVELLLQHGADVHADTGLDCMQGHGPTALHIALDKGTFYGERDNLGPEMLRVAEILVEHGANVEGVADHIVLDDVLKFEGFEGLWEKLRKGVGRKGTGARSITPHSSRFHATFASLWSNFLKVVPVVAKITTFT